MNAMIVLKLVFHQTTDFFPQKDPFTLANYLVSKYLKIIPQKYYFRLSTRLSNDVYGGFKFYGSELNFSIKTLSKILKTHQEMLSYEH